MAPFLYTWPGFETEELAPWEENGEVWRPLKITYPDSIASHPGSRSLTMVGTACCDGTLTPSTSSGGLRTQLCL